MAGFFLGHKRAYRKGSLLREAKIKQDVSEWPDYHRHGLANLGDPDLKGNDRAVDIATRRPRIGRGVV